MQQTITARREEAGGRAAWHIVQATRAVLAAGLLGSVAVLARTGDPGRVDWWLGLVPMLLWLSVPYAFVAAATGWLGSRLGPALANLAAALVFAGFSLWTVAAFFWMAPEAETPLMLIFLPFYQGAVYVPFAVLAVLLHHRRER